jgi:NMD protein affecting ribosome stability and mRNA decay
MYSGKCSKCNVIKADFEEIPAAFDVLLCNQCFDQVSKNVKQELIIKQTLEELEKAQSSVFHAHSILSSLLG